MIHCAGTRTEPVCQREAEFIVNMQRSKDDRGPAESVRVCRRCLPGVIVGLDIWEVKRF